MTEFALSAPATRVKVAPALFTATIFISAALVFLVEPMIGKLLLPRLGGSPAVWNTSLAFFQTALLAGYVYAHLLQRVPSVRAQVLVHLCVMAAAATALPLRLSGVLGAPGLSSPIAWLAGELALSIGAPFAALSATAPLLQAWYARLPIAEREESPYGLYAASNVGSLLALIAYPLAVEPHLTLAAQRAGWSWGYGLLACLMAGVGLLAARRPSAPAAPIIVDRAAPGSWRERAVWVGLSAVPSSLMLGVTSHLASDVGSAPFLWVAPLALYLLSFVLAFQPKPVLPWAALGPVQAAALVTMLLALVFPAGDWVLQLSLTLFGFFLTALVCHQSLYARRPPPERLTEFYLLMSFGGMLGGFFNALLAPALFVQVWEYPLALVAAAACRPADKGRAGREARIVLALGALAVCVLLGLALVGARPVPVVLTCLCTAGAAAFLLRDSKGIFPAFVAGLALAVCATAQPLGTVEVRRSFFGVHRVIAADIPGAGRYYELVHGTTLHGAQAERADRRCTPLAYYAEAAPIAQTLRAVQAKLPGARIGVVGLGTGALAAYTRPTDRLRYFEIDPVVLTLARDSGRFTYLTWCAAGRVDYVMGDARLTMATQPTGGFDLLAIDAFSSDTIPTHLLTREALATYFRTLSPHGVLLLHLSNRNLDLTRSAAATIRLLGAEVLAQEYHPAQDGSNQPLRSATRVLIAGRSAEALAPFAADPRWRKVDSTGVRPWTDDYSDVLGPLLANLQRARGR